MPAHAVPECSNQFGDHIPTIALRASRALGSARCLLAPSIALREAVSEVLGHGDAKDSAEVRCVTHHVRQAVCQPFTHRWNASTHRVEVQMRGAAHPGVLLEE